MKSSQEKTFGKKQTLIIKSPTINTLDWLEGVNFVNTRGQTYDRKTPSTSYHNKYTSAPK